VFDVLVYAAAALEDDGVVIVTVVVAIGGRLRRRRTEMMVVQLSARRLTKATARMMCDPHVQLLAPLVFYTGASLGFLLNDFTVVSDANVM